MTPTSVKLPPQAMKRVKRAARLRGVAPAAFMRHVIVESAEKVIAEHTEACPHCGSSSKKKSAA